MLKPPKPEATWAGPFGRQGGAFSRGLLGILLVLCVWQGLASANIINAVLLPAPLTLFSTTLELLADGTLIRHIGASMERVLVGVFCASVVGLTLGVLFGWSQRLSEYGKPIVEALRPIPPIAWTPLAILWFGIGNAPSYFLVFIGAIFPVFVSTYSAVRNIERTQINAALCLGATPGMLISRHPDPRGAARDLSGPQDRARRRLDVRGCGGTDRRAVGPRLHDPAEPRAPADAECRDRHDRNRRHRLCDERRS